MRNENEKDLARHQKYVRKKLFGIGGLKLKKFYKMCEIVAWRRVRPNECRKQCREMLEVAKELMPLPPEEMKKQNCPANAILFVHNCSFGPKRFAVNVPSIRVGLVKSVGKDAFVTMNGFRPQKYSLLAWGIWR